MTKEEYEKLLQSDYWKGYSFSLIKERNFTCEDCGKTFLNERNKLQVHHLLYRDVNPWSYKPEEVVVLCKECHEKRHGIFHKDNQDDIQHHETSNFTQSTTLHYDSKAERTYPRNNYYNPHNSNRNWTKFVVFCLIAIAALSVTLPFATSSHKHTNKSDNLTTSTQNTEKSHPQPKYNNEANGNEAMSQQQEEIHDGIKRGSIPQKEKKATMVQYLPEAKSNASKSTSNDISHQDAVQQAKRAGVSTEGSTLDIMERISHQNAVQQAKRAGVSTEGSTLDIMERTIQKQLSK